MLADCCETRAEEAAIISSYTLLYNGIHNPLRSPVFYASIIFQFVTHGKALKAYLWI